MQFARQISQALPSQANATALLAAIHKAPAGELQGCTVQLSWKFGKFGWFFKKLDIKSVQSNFLESFHHPFGAFGPWNILFFLQVHLFWREAAARQTWDMNITLKWRRFYPWTPLGISAEVHLWKMTWGEGEKNNRWNRWYCDRQIELRIFTVGPRRAP